MADDAHYSGIHSKFTREQIAEMEVGKTNVSRGVRFALVAGFLFTILSVPIIQQTIEIRAGNAPKVFDVFGLPAAAARAYDNPDIHGLWTKIQAGNSAFLKGAKSYEKALEDNSFLAQAGIPRMQAFTASFLGLGNEEVYLGRQGWLFYQPEVGYLSGEGFLAPDFLRSRARGAEIQPNPVKAIVQFRDALKARGIELLLLPAPVKPMIEPEHLSSRYQPPLPIPLRNPSYSEFLRELDAAGVDYLDVSDTLAAEKLRTGLPQYVLTDTHWRPEAMEIAAGKLAEKIRALGLADGAPVNYTQTAESVTNLGDIATMLKLPSWSTLYPKQTLTIHPVSNADGSPWTADPGATILLLGDS